MERRRVNSQTLIKKSHLFWKFVRQNKSIGREFTHSFGCFSSKYTGVVGAHRYLNFNVKIKKIPKKVLIYNKIINKFICFTIFFTSPLI